MCGICGCEHEHGHPHEHRHASARSVQLETDLLAKNDRLASRNRTWFGARSIRAFNVMGAPGAGKTTLLEKTIERLQEQRSIGVIEGDQASDRDAMRIRATGCPVVQINTGAGCHLDAEMVFEGLGLLSPEHGSLLFIENVGNLVCPAMFDLGEGGRVLVASVTEGEDKPLKYPHMFRACDSLVVTKTDLLPHLSFDLDAFLGAAREVNPKLRSFTVSLTNGDGLGDWCEFVLRSNA